MRDKPTKGLESGLSPHVMMLMEVLLDVRNLHEICKDPKMSRIFLISIHGRNSSRVLHLAIHVVNGKGWFVALCFYGMNLNFWIVGENPGPKQSRTDHDIDSFFEGKG